MRRCRFADTTSARGVGAECRLGFLRVAGWGRGDRRPSHSAAASAESGDGALDPAGSPVTSSSALKWLPVACSLQPGRRGGAGRGWGLGAGRSLGAGKEPRPLPRARSPEKAPGVAAAARSLEGACPFRAARAGRVPVSSLRGAGGEEEEGAPCGAGSTCLRLAGGSLCSEKSQASEGGCETERPVSVRVALFICLPPHKTPPAPDATAPPGAANGCYGRCGQTGSPAPYPTGRPGRTRYRRPQWGRRHSSFR